MALSAGMAAVLAAAAWWAAGRVAQPLDLAYTVDLSAAASGRLLVTLDAAGSLPPTLTLVRPRGLFDGVASAPPVAQFAAWNHTQDGGRGAPLPWRATSGGWTVDVRSARAAPAPASLLAGPGRDGGAGGETNAALLRPAATVQYTVQLAPGRADAADIRGHVSELAADGWRAGAFHLFLVPDRLAVRAVAVRFAGGESERLAAPWPAAGTAAGIVYRPADMDDLTNALLAGGGLRLREEDVGGCALRLAMRGAWDFPDAELARLLLRLGEAEIAFFGAAPQPSALILVERNPLPAGAGFDYLGLHVGHSVLLLLEPRTTWADLSGKAASVAAHELFHGWLGEAIRPAGPELDWFVEGATAWYTGRFLVETGTWTAERAEWVIGSRIGQHYQASPLLGERSLADAAADLLRDGETTRFVYAGSCLAAAALDAWLARPSAAGAGDPAAAGAGELAAAGHPLDAVLRDLYARRAQGPLTREGLESAVRRATGRDCGPWLDQYVYGKETLPRPRPMF